MSLRSRALGTALWLACSATLCPELSAQEAATAIYVRADDDETTVVTPRLRVQVAPHAGTQLELAYSVDVWSSASIDIRSTASKRVTEQRDQIDLALGQELADVRLRGSYRFSSEPDYLSHGGSVGAELDLAQRASTLALDLTATFDRVGRVGLPSFDRRASVWSARGAFSQVLTPDLLAQAIYELGLSSGYLASPYRFVGIGTDDGLCAAEDPEQAVDMTCVAESAPERRLLHALGLRARYALGPAWSVGGEYRFYVDDWALSSHTAELRGAWLFDDAGELALRYRFYTQSAAEHYRSHYESFEDGRHYTRDKELSPLHSQRIALDLSREVALGGSRVRVVLGIGPTFYTYRDHAQLDGVTAFETTLSTVLVP